MDQELSDLMKENNKLLRAVAKDLKTLVELAIEHIKEQQNLVIYRKVD